MTSRDRSRDNNNVIDSLFISDVNWIVRITLYSFMKLWNNCFLYSVHATSSSPPPHSTMSAEGRRSRSEPVSSGAVCCLLLRVTLFTAKSQSHINEQINLLKATVSDSIERTVIADCKVPWISYCNSKNG